MKICYPLLAVTVAISAGLFVSSAAMSATSTTTFGVHATVEAACNVSASELVFGNFSALGGARDATGFLLITCSNSTPYDIGLDAGDGTGATVSDRLMTHSDGSSTLAYSLYSDPGRTSNWGETVDVDTVADVGTGMGRPHTIYGRVPDPSLAMVGAFTDTVTVTVTY